MSFEDRCVPLLPSGYLSVDGESFPHEPFDVQCHPKIARVLSLDGNLHGLPSITLP